MKKILITGGAGFIGSNLGERLVENGDHVICLDDFSTGRKENIAHLMNKQNFEVISHDIIQPLRIEADEIYNLACPASPLQYQYNPIRTLKTNVLGSLNILDLARRFNSRILQASTSEIYGDPLMHPQTEEYRGNVNPIGPRACYDEGKRCAEGIFFDYHRQYGVDIKVVRLFNTYGPKMDTNDGRVVSNFIVQALQNEDITIYGEGTQTRSFCYVDDIIEGLIKMMGSSEDFLGPVNLGNPVEISIKQLAEKVIELTDSKSKLLYLPLPEDDPIRRKPDISLAKESLGWEPKVPLNNGLKKTIGYFHKITSHFTATGGLLQTTIR